MKEVRYHEEARAELFDAVDWYDRQREGLGEELNAAVEHAVEAIARSPAASDLHDGVAIRRYVLRRFPYVLLISGIC